MKWATLHALPTGVAGLLPPSRLGRSPSSGYRPLAFRGTFDHTLDAKNRLTVPSKFRAALADGVVLAKGFEPCAGIWRTRDYERYVEESLGPYPRVSDERARLKRFFSSNAWDTELDSAGRVMIPPRLMELAELRRDVRVIGADDCLEVWAPETWERYRDESDATVKDIRAGVGHAA